MLRIRRCLAALVLAVLFTYPAQGAEQDQSTDFLAEIVEWVEDALTEWFFGDQEPPDDEFGGEIEPTG